jgi:hypothetical protein
MSVVSIATKYMQIEDVQSDTTYQWAAADLQTLHPLRLFLLRD